MLSELQHDSLSKDNRIQQLGSVATDLDPYLKLWDLLWSVRLSGFSSGLLRWKQANQCHRWKSASGISLIFKRTGWLNVVGKFDPGALLELPRDKGGKKIEPYRPCKTAICCRLLSKDFERRHFDGAPEIENLSHKHRFGICPSEINSVRFFFCILSWTSAFSNTVPKHTDYIALNKQLWK